LALRLSEGLGLSVRCELLLLIFVC
jgi:hypothetical protein